MQGFWLWNNHKLYARRRPDGAGDDYKVPISRYLLVYYVQNIKYGIHLQITQKITCILYFSGASKYAIFFNVYIYSKPHIFLEFSQRYYASDHLDFGSSKIQCFQVRESYLVLQRCLQKFDSSLVDCPKNEVWFKHVNLDSAKIYKSPTVHLRLFTLIYKTCVLLRI